MKWNFWTLLILTFTASNRNEFMSTLSRLVPSLSRGISGQGSDLKIWVLRDFVFEFSIVLKKNFFIALELEKLEATQPHALKKWGVLSCE
jgi:hypothetical protein